jgi:glycosyltransferase involved in cell wall biosynthesis
LVADDASTDGTTEIIESIGSPLIQVIRAEAQQGISKNCNEMIRRAKCRYLARMDADDIAHPDRFRLQMARLQSSDVNVLGTWARRMGGADMLHATPVEDADIRANLGFSSPFVNPTVMFDRAALGDDIYYDPDILFGADYDQFARLRHRATFGNVAKVLLLWRAHERNAGSDPRSLRLQNQTVARVRSTIWAENGVPLDEAEENALGQLVRLPLPSVSDSRHHLSALRKALSRSGSQELWAPRAALRSAFLEQWSYYCLVHAWGNTDILRLWRNGVRELGGRTDLSTFAKIAMKSLLKRSRQGNRAVL